MWWWNAQGWWSTGTQVLAACTTIAVFALGVVAVFLVLQYLRTRNRGPADVLAERFAAGEIDEFEYERRLRVLAKHTDDAVDNDPALV